MYHTLEKAIIIFYKCTATYENKMFIRHTFSHSFRLGKNSTFLRPEFYTVTPPLSFHIKIRL